MESEANDTSQVHSEQSSPLHPTRLSFVHPNYYLFATAVPANFLSTFFTVPLSCFLYWTIENVFQCPLTLEAQACFAMSVLPGGHIQAKHTSLQPFISFHLLLE